MELEKFGTAGDIQELLSIRDDIENLSFGTHTDASKPKIDLLDRGQTFQLIIEVPGVPQENLEVAVQENKVMIAGFREPMDDASIIASERHRGHFERTIELPAEVKGENVQARLAQGLLILNLEKQ